MAINVRRPRGKTTEQLSAEIGTALADWQARRLPLANIKVNVREPWILENAPQVPTLLSTFAYFTGMQDARRTRIRSGWAKGVKLDPVKLAVRRDGKIEVIDGRHRLAEAISQGRRIAARFVRGV
mgnify:CR=1 FL=1